MVKTVTVQQLGDGEVQNSTDALVKNVVSGEDSSSNTSILSGDVMCSHCVPSQSSCRYNEEHSV